ncbi:hypothetical protein SPPR111872_05430 [Sphingobacterium prati]
MAYFDRPKVSIDEHYNDCIRFSNRYASTHHTFAQRMEKLWDGAAGKNCVSRNKGQLFVKENMCHFIQKVLFSVGK